MPDTIERCLICRHPIPEGTEDYCAKRSEDGGLVCPECLVLVRKGHVGALRRLRESKRVF